ncbi:hypothetical protein F5B22DRAFT_600923 [Xylaria bambusicola]|uniref:uncharacterized protein n=1 Tax=Xylaria bambusicola TaxID=326684 RepID=UPI002008EAD5|nr:uncharacterized protein F5B22DRAFT_600923 [Xylaria bambusicola]KAI0518361.1 hypothetical protein F5B22DRAFT_600923 [Xylaria bambusicola]
MFGSPRVLKLTFAFAHLNIMPHVKLAFTVCVVDGWQIFLGKMFYVPNEYIGNIGFRTATLTLNIHLVACHPWFRSPNTCGITCRHSAFRTTRSDPRVSMSSYSTCT